MATNPITLTPVGGLPYQVVRGHMVMLYTGAWVLDIDLSADSVQLQGLPSGKCVVMFGGVPMSGTIDPNASGVFGPTARVRVVAGAGAWGTPSTAQDWHSDAGVLSTVVYSSVATALGEVVVDSEPEILGVDVVYNGTDPASAIFGDRPWWVDTTGITNVGARVPSVADLSLVIRDWDPICQKATFSCDTLLIPNTQLVDPRFGTTVYAAQNVEQIFDGQGSIGWAWATPVTAAAALVPTTPATTLVSDLKAAVLQWTRASSLRVYRYRLISYQGNGPAGGPMRMALQAVTPSSGVPNILPVAPWSGVAGIVAELAPSQEVLVAFENADPTLPRVIGYSLIASGGQNLGLPLKITADASVEIDLGVTAPLVNLGAQAALVNVAGGTDFLVLATPYEALLSDLATFCTSVAASIVPPPTSLPQAIASIGAIAAAATALGSALSGLPPPATTKTKAT